jgi:hypothetical protein
MISRTNFLVAQLTSFAKQYARKSQKGIEPNDRQYSRKAEATMKHLSPEELSAVLNSETDERVPMVKTKNPTHVRVKNGRGP